MSPHEWRKKSIGLEIAGAATGKIARCCVEGNDDNGIVVKDQAQVILDSNTCQDNGKHGIVVQGQARPSLTKNVCRNNRGNGIEVSDHAQPVLENNILQANQKSGIAYDGSSRDCGGLARWNQCVGNAHDGIFLRTAEPIIEENTCQENQNNGIQYSYQAGGVARKNRCIRNGGSVRSDGSRPYPSFASMSRGAAGIKVSGDSQPLLDHNVCVENAGRGITIIGSGKTRVESNECSGNRFGDDISWVEA